MYMWEMGPFFCTQPFKCCSVVSVSEFLLYFTASLFCDKQAFMLHFTLSLSLSHRHIGVESRR